MLGAPLVNNFLSRARALRYSGKLPQELCDHFDTLFQYQDDLYKARKTLGIDFNNLETVFSILDMNWQTARITISEPSHRMLQSLRTDFFTVIIETLRRSICSESSEEWSEYKRMIQFLAAARNATFITFNYDLSIEKALARTLGNKEYQDYVVHYGTDLVRPAPQSVTGRLVLKLHGSANWTYCPQCDHLTNFKIPNVSTDFEYITPLEFASNRGLLHKPMKDCQPDGVLNVIIPPTWYKTNYLDVFTKVWLLSIEEISKATHLFIIGYSFPKTDVFFEQLLTLGLHDNKNLKRVVVINPSEATGASLDSLFDKHFLNRVLFIQKNFEDFGRHVFEPVSTESNLNKLLE